MMKLWQKLDEYQGLARPEACQRLGGKATGLLRAKTLGFSVPQSFILEQKKIQNFLESLESYPNAALAYQQMKICRCDFEPFQKLRDEIANSPLLSSLFPVQLNLLGSWIFRSSAVLEDSDTSALAGCFASKVFYACDARAGLDALIQVLQSPYTETALRNLLGLGIEFSEIQMAVLLQPHLPVKLAGVAFSRHPLNLWNVDSGIVEYQRQSSDAVVNGLAAEQSALKDPAPEGLPNHHWQDLRLLCQKLDQTYLGPVDIEWALSEEKLVLLQVRPVATEEAQIIRQSHKDQLWTRETTQERFPEPISPLGWDSLQDAFQSSVRGLGKYLGIKLPQDTKKMAAYLYGYVYSDKNFLSTKQANLFLLQRVFQIQSLAKLAWGICFAVFQTLTSKSFLKFGDRLAILFCQVLLGDRVEKILKAFDLANQDLDRALAKQEQDTAQGRDLAPLIQASKKLGIRYLETDFAIYAAKNILFVFVQKILASHDLWSKLSFPTVNPTLALQASFRDFALSLKQEGKDQLFLEKLLNCDDARLLQGLSTDLDKTWQILMRDLGHISLSWDLRAGSLRERPMQIHAIFTALLKSDSLKKIEETNSIKASDLPKELQNMVEQLRALMQADETQHFNSGKIMANARDLVGRAKIELMTKGVLAEADDIYFLTVSELIGALEEQHGRFGFLAKRRKKQWLQNPWQGYPPHELGYGVKFNQNDSKKKYEASADTWFTASVGQAQGPAAFAESFEDAAALEPGSILFTSCPKPELVALYPVLGGIVTETGGLLSHGFVAARELGIPAMSGFRGFQNIRAGEWIKLDATQCKIEQQGVHL